VELAYVEAEIQFSLRVALPLLTDPNERLS